MVNLLPKEMNYYFKGTEIAGTVKAGQEAQLHAVSNHYCKCSIIVSDTHCTMVNLLPIEMNYYFKGTEIAGTVKAGQEAQLHAVSNHYCKCSIIVSDTHCYHGKPTAYRNELLFQGYRNSRDSQSWTRGTASCCK